MKNTVIFKAIASTLLCLCLFNSCTEKNGNEISEQEQQTIDLTETIRALIVGRWQSAESSYVTIEFTPGGSFISINQNSYPSTMSGSYTIQGNKLFLHFTNYGEEETSVMTVVNVDEKYLEMDTVDGIRLIFRRIS